MRLAIIGFGIGLLVLFVGWSDGAAARNPRGSRWIAGRSRSRSSPASSSRSPSRCRCWLPRYFSIVDRYGTIFGLIALAPLFIGLVAAGPVAGFLLSRFSPRILVAGGLVARRAGQPRGGGACGPRRRLRTVRRAVLLVGVGFVLATTVRTAIIFASVPRGLPATAAALNEASIAVGNRMGIVIVTGIGRPWRCRRSTSSMSGSAPAVAAASRQQFADLLYAAGTPAFASLAERGPSDDAIAYIDHYVTGVRSVMALGGLAAVLGGIVVWFALGRRDPIAARGVDPMATVYAHRDERTAVEP